MSVRLLVVSEYRSLTLFVSQRKRDVQFILLNCKQVTLETGLHQVLIANTSIYCNYKINTVVEHIVAGLANFPCKLKSFAVS